MRTTLPPPQTGAELPQIFGPCLLRPNGWMDEAGILGMKVGLSPGDFVLDGDPVPFPKKGRSPSPPIFGPFLLWPNGSMHQDATWYGCWPQLRGLCVRWRPSLPSPTSVLLWPNGWVHHDATWYGGKPQAASAQATWC